jgi:YihY family inner membrane protein
VQLKLLDTDSRLIRWLRPTFRYWMETEVHVHGFAIAANVLLSFFPFLIVMISFCRYVLGWPEAERAIHMALADYFPDELGDFLQRNLKATVSRRGGSQLASIFLLLFTANGIFLPLEVALNRVWRCTANRSFLKNQGVSLMLIFACGTLAMISITLTALNREFMKGAPSAATEIATFFSLIFFKMAAVPISILALFLVYWLLPNCKLPAKRVIPAAIIVGVLLEALKYLNLFIWPWLRVKLIHEYGPFVNSVAIVLWAFMAAMLMLAGAEWTSRRHPLSPERGAGYLSR